jgi:DNA-binding beta-propeller fold protein YncE
MNTRLATAAAALALLQLVALASQGWDAPDEFAAGTPVAAVANGVVAWSPDGAALPQPLTGLSGAVDVCFAPDGTLFVSDEGADAVLRCDAGGAILGSLGEGTALADPAGLALGPAGALYVASRGTDSVLVFDATGAPAGELGADADLHAPWGLAFDARGRLAVASSGGDEVALLDPSGARVGSVGAGALASPRGLCFGRDGRLYVADHDDGRVAVFDAAGELSGSLDAGGTLGAPIGLAFGPDGLLYVASGSSGTVLALDADGAIAGVLPAGNALPGLCGLAFAPQLMRATVKGLIQRPGENKGVLKGGAGVLALRPGALPVSLQFDDPGGDAAAALGLACDWFGWDLGGDAPAFDGLQLGPAAAQRGVLALHLELKGKPQAGPTSAASWQASKATGLLHGALPQAVIDASVKSGKRLN